MPASIRATPLTPHPPPSPTHHTPRPTTHRHAPRTTITTIKVRGRRALQGLRPHARRRAGAAPGQRHADRRRAGVPLPRLVRHGVAPGAAQGDADHRHPQRELVGWGDWVGLGGIRRMMGGIGEWRHSMVADDGRRRRAHSSTLSSASLPPCPPHRADRAELPAALPQHVQLPHRRGGAARL